MHLSGKFKYAEAASDFCFPCPERLIFNKSIYGLFLVNWYGQIYPGYQNAKEISLKVWKVWKVWKVLKSEK